MVAIEIKNLSVSINNKKILDDVSFNINEGEICLLMGPNGSGKSTLASVLMGHPAYQIEAGQIFFKGQDIISLKVEERANLGMFMSFQQPREINGVDFYSFLFDAYKNVSTARGEEVVDAFDFRQKIDEELKLLHINQDWSDRYLNHGFSGGEKKKAEMLQLAMLKPRFAIFDEVDSGLDVDALEIVGQALARFKTPENSALVVTHYQKILKYIKPDKVIVLKGGKVVAEGDYELALRLEKEGFNQSLNN